MSVNSKQYYVNKMLSFESQWAHVLDRDAMSALKQHKAYLAAYPEEELAQRQIEAYSHLNQLSESLQNTGVSNDQANTVLKISLRMTCFGILQETLSKHMQLLAFKEKALKAAIQMRGEKIRTQLIQVNEDGLKVKVRESSNPWGSKRCDWISAEVEAVLGTGNIPYTIAANDQEADLGYLLIAACIDRAWNVKEGMMFRQDAAQVIRSVDPFAMQLFLLTGLLRGRADGNPGNTMIQQKGSSAVCWDVDEEEAFLSPNRKIVDGVDYNIGYITGIGFPQARIPFDPWIMKMFMWRGLKDKIIAQLNVRGLKDRSQTFAERYEIIFNRFQDALAHHHNDLTPQQLFHAIYGREEIYKKSRMENHTHFEIYSIDIQVEQDQLSPSEREKWSWFPEMYQAPYFQKNAHELE